MLTVASIASIAALPVAARVGDAAEPDAELLARGRLFDSQWVDYVAAAKRRAQLHDIFCDRAPAEPAALAIRPGDDELKLTRRSLIGGTRVTEEDETHFGSEEVERLRKHPPRRRVEIDCAKWKASHPCAAPEKDPFRPGDVVISSEPWPEAQARANEIVQAYDSWQGNAMAVRAEIGLTRTEEAEGIAFLQAHLIAQEIVETRATTAAGMAVKARIMSVRREAGCGAAVFDQQLTWSIVRDLIGFPQPPDPFVTGLRAVNIPPSYRETVYPARLRDLAAQFEAASADFLRRFTERAGLDDDDDESVAGLCAPIDAVREAMAAMPAATVDGLVAKAHAAAWFYDGGYYWNRGDLDSNLDNPEARALVTSILQDIVALRPEAALADQLTPLPLQAA
jgi:hypothetical protein